MMCGLAGIFSTNPNLPVEARLEVALQRMFHRGPDGNGRKVRRWEHGVLALGHRRLAIIDLSKNGQQPMTSEDGRYTIVFNGEIYNYKKIRKELRAQGIFFQTNTDTEVLLKAYIHWGDKALPRLVGMFAFVIEDKERNVLECVRDSFGIKPFFYSHSKGYFAFASEVSAVRDLISTPSKLNFQRAFDYLLLGRYDDRSAMFIENLMQLMPGYRMLVDMNSTLNIEIKKWCPPPPISQQKLIHFDDAVELVQAQFLENVRLHLHSDVPIGAALSGGVDSSALVCAMRKLEPDMDIHTFSYVAAKGVSNEEQWANIVNEYVNAISHKVTIGNDDLFADLDDLIKVQGEPFGSTSVYASYRVYKMVRESGITVCLDGQGADEIFAGYHGYPQYRLLSLLESYDFSGIKYFLKEWSKWPDRQAIDPLIRLIGEFVPGSLQATGYKVIGRHLVKAWMRKEVLEQVGVSIYPYKRHVWCKEGRRRRLVEFERYLLGDGGFCHLLRHGDRNSMRWSIESRVPFLTNDLVALAFSLPENHLVTDQGETKAIFRAAMRGIVPDPILDRQDKVGFETPELHWLNSTKLNIDQTIEPVSGLGIFDMDELKREVSEILSGEKPFSWQSWRIINYCKWVRIVLFG